MIVMTVPMQFHRPNIAVGSNLRGFLCLGCMIGYFNLEQLAYDYVSTAAELAGEPPYVGEDADRCLTLLRDRLSLAPWADPRSRLDELQGLLPPVP